MNIKKFLDAQVDAMGRRGRELDAVREAMIEGDTPPECIDFVMQQISAIYDKQSSTAMHDGSPSAIATAHAAETLFRPVIADLTFALVVALAEVWYLRRGAADPRCNSSAESA